MGRREKWEGGLVWEVSRAPRRVLFLSLRGVSRVLRLCVTVLERKEGNVS